MTSYRIKDIARINRQTLPEDTDPDFRFRYVDISAVDSLGNVTVPEDDITFAKAPSRARRLASAGSVAISTVRTYLRAIGTVPETRDPLVFSTGFAVLEAGPLADGRFLAYYCRSQPFIDDVVARSTGVSYPAINPSEIGNLPMPLLPLERQRRIADFLDAETAHIDGLIQSRKAQIELLRDRQAALKARCVTYDGADRLEHPVLGRINPFWKILPLRRAIPAINVGVVINPSHFFSESGVPFIHGFNVREGFISSNGMKFMTEEDNEAHRRSKVFAGDVLVVRAGATAGRAAMVGDEFNKSNCASVLILRRSEGVYPKYLETFFNSASGKGQVSFSQYGAAQEVISAGQVGSFVLPVPELNEQKERVARLEAATRQTSHLENAFHNQVAILQERRQALITAAVTGQFDVSTASGRNVTEGVPA
ncbi:restriction endonuclease subunit S [Streptomyces sp. NPDC059894]|uniref:restriction endonuclease subunit S n=1 Tax=unclassified Streptomyces TaxID=2593676 RepID=UPI00366373B7